LEVEHLIILNHDAALESVVVKTDVEDVHIDFRLQRLLVWAVAAGIVTL
jgi:hypothetical protein